MSSANSAQRSASPVPINYLYCGGSQEYMREWASGELHIVHPLECPNCGYAGVWASKGSYMRRPLITAEHAPYATPAASNVLIARIRCKHCDVSFGMLPSFLVPFKHHGAEVISATLHDVYSTGCSPWQLEQEGRLAGIHRRTAERWVRQFGETTPAHLQIHVPQLPGLDQASVSRFPVPERRRRRGSASAVRLWVLLFAWAVMQGSGACARSGRKVLPLLQPVLSRMRPPCGVFRVPLNERSRAPPR